MSWLPKSRKARARLLVIAAVAPVLMLSVGLGLYGMRGSLSLFYTPSQARAALVPAGRRLQLGGIVGRRSLHQTGPDSLAFTIADARTAVVVGYAGALPDLFREGQGVVVQGAFQADGTFRATEVLAKHDERYLPRQLARALADNGANPSGRNRP